MTDPGGLFVLIPSRVFSKETRSCKGRFETCPYLIPLVLFVSFVVKASPRKQLNIPFANSLPQLRKRLIEHLERVVDLIFVNIE